MKRVVPAVVAAFALLIGALSTGSALAQADGYKLIDPPIRTASEDKVEVLEYFWFGCPHCYAFEPAINQWNDSKPDYVEFRREAPPLNPSWLPHSQAFYAMEIMGVTEQMFEPLFDAIHKEKRNLRKPKDLAAFAGEMGVDKDKFLKTMKSFAVDARIRQAMEKARAAGLTGVPSIVINGKYVTGGSIAGSNANVINVINRMSEIENQS